MCQPTDAAAGLAIVEEPLAAGDHRDARTGHQPEEEVRDEEHVCGTSFMRGSMAGRTSQRLTA